jgi:foldase protein PrsA
VPANAQLAARVNGQGIALDLFNRQMTQAQAAFVQQGVDTKSTSGQEALKSLRQQVLDQMINDTVIAQQAEKEGIKVTDNDVNARLAQMIQDAGSVDKLNEYLKQNQITLADFCSQIRSNVVGEAMLNRVTSALPTKVEQVHVRQILVSTAAQAQQVKKQLDAGGDFAALAKQYSLDESSKTNGGDLGWAPKGRFDPQFEAVAFQLKVGQVSDVVQTQFGYHLIKVEGHESARELPPELLQNARQQAFLTWLQAVRQGIKIERLVQ